MLSPESSSNWLYDYCFEDIPLPHSSFSCPMQSPPILRGLNIDVSFGEQQGVNEATVKKRTREDSCVSSSSKNAREKLRRDKLNDKFADLDALLEPGRPLKTDKAAILADAVRVVSQLRSEAQKLKDSNSSLHHKIKELKDVKNELRDEKQRLKVEKEKLEQQLRTMNVHPGKLVPVVSYPGVAMWQFMPSSAVDTSQDHVLRPPVA